MISVGAVDVLPLIDAEGILGELDELFPTVPAETWRPYRQIYPELFVGTRWRLPFGCYLLRTPTATALVDTGIGPPGVREWEHERQGVLPDALAAAGVAPDEIDLVVFTHLHNDHVGWNAHPDGAPFFTNARYLAHHDALRYARTRTHLPHIRRCVTGLERRFDEVIDGHQILPGVRAVALPGHHPGHIGVQIGRDRAAAIILGDAAPHPALLDAPDWRFAADHRPDQTTATRRRLVSDLAGTDTIVICGHYPHGGIGRLALEHGCTIWRALQP